MTDLLTEGSRNHTYMVSVWRVTAERKLINTEDGQIDYLWGNSNPNTARDLVSLENSYQESETAVKIMHVFQMKTVGDIFVGTVTLRSD